MTRRSAVVVSAQSEQTNRHAALSNVTKSSARVTREASAQLQEEADAAFKDGKDDISSHIESLKGKKARQQLAKQRPNARGHLAPTSPPKTRGFIEGIGERLHKSPRVGSTGKQYNARDIFREQRNGTKVDFDSAPSQWDVPPGSNTPKKSNTKTSKQKKLRGRPRKNMFDYSDIDSEKPTPKPSAKRGRPRKSSLPPSPLGVRVSTRQLQQQKRARDESPEVGHNKRAKAAAAQPRPYGTRRQYLARANREPSPVVEETEAESDDDYPAGPAADQEEELPSGDAEEDEGEAEEVEEELKEVKDDEDEVVPVSTYRLRSRRGMGSEELEPLDDSQTRTRAIRQQISPIPEQSPDTQPKTPPNQYDDEEEEEEEENDIEELEEEETDMEVDGDDNSDLFVPDEPAIVIDDSDSEVDEDGVEVTQDQDDVDGVAKAKQQSSSRKDRVALSDKSPKKSSSTKQQITPVQSTESRLPQDSIEEEEEEAAQQLQAENNQHLSGSTSPADSAAGFGVNHAGLDADLEELKYLDLTHLMRRIVPVGNRHPQAVEIVNDLLKAGQLYLRTLTEIGFYHDGKPDRNKFTNASPQLKELYTRIDIFITQLDDDVDIVGGRLAGEHWVELDKSLESLKNVIRGDLKSKSVPRLYAYGLFSMIPLIATATRLHLSSEMVDIDDQKRSLKLLILLCQAYDQLQLKFKEFKAARGKGHDPPIYKQAYEFRKRYVALANYAKTTLREFTKDEQNAERLRIQEAIEQALLETQRRKESFKATGFDEKRNRLILLWNTRQRKEVDPYRRHILGSAGINEYLKTVKPSGHVSPSAAFDASQDPWSNEEITCLATLLKKYYMLGPQNMWERVINDSCGYRGLLKKRPMDQMLNYAKLLKLSELDHESPDDFWNKIPDLDLCELLPVRLQVAEEFIHGED